jgi:hypothetical protein
MKTDDIRGTELPPMKPDPGMDAKPAARSPDARATASKPVTPLSAIIIAGVLSLLFVVLAGSTDADPDMFHEMALIRESLATGSLLRDDVWAYTPTVSPVIHHEWATGAVLYFIAVVLGLGGTGIILLRGVLMATVVAGCWWAARLRGAPGAMLALLAPFAITLMAIGTTPVRAHHFTFAFTALLMAFIELDRQGKRAWLAVWLPLYVAWLNLHGGFVVGAGLFALYTVERLATAWRDTASAAAALRPTRHLLLAGVGMAALTLVNPYGWEYVPYLWHALTLDRPLVAEWAPLWDARVQGEYEMLYGMTIIVLLYALARAPSPARLPGLLLVLAAAFVAARSQRLLPIHGIVWLAHVPGWLAATDLRYLVERTAHRHRRIVAGAVLVLSVVLLGKSVQLRFWELRISTTEEDANPRYPAGATAYLAEHGFRGNLMTSFNSGAFVLWKLYPAVRIGLDSRYEVAYPPEAAAENVALYAGDEGWHETLRRYPTDAVLVPLWSGLYETLEQDGPEAGEWQCVYRDDGFAVYVRQGNAAGLPTVDRSGQTIIGTFP